MGENQWNLTMVLMTLHLGGMKQPGGSAHRATPGIFCEPLILGAWRVCGGSACLLEEEPCGPPCMDPADTATSDLPTSRERRSKFLLFSNHRRQAWEQATTVHPVAVKNTRGMAVLHREVEHKQQTHPRFWFSPLAGIIQAELEGAGTQTRQALMWDIEGQAVSHGCIECPLIPKLELHS